MDRIKQLFLLLALVAALHVGEQLAFGIGEWFANPAWLLVAIVGLVAMVLGLGLLAGGVRRLVAGAVFGLIGVSEGHHLVAAFLGSTYNPGVFTAALLVAAGVLMLLAVRSEHRRTRIVWADVTPAYQTW